MQQVASTLLAEADPNLGSCLRLALALRHYTACWLCLHGVLAALLLGSALRRRLRRRRRYPFPFGDTQLGTSTLESFQDFLIELDMKPRMHLVKISIFSLNNVTVRPTKIMNNLLEYPKILIFKVIFQC